MRVDGKERVLRLQQERDALCAKPFAQLAQRTEVHVPIRACDYQPRDLAPSDQFCELFSNSHRTGTGEKAKAAAFVQIDNGTIRL